MFEKKLKEKLTVFFKAYRIDDPEVLKIYSEYLKKLNNTNVLAVLDNIILFGFKNNKVYFPKIAEIVEAVIGIDDAEITQKWLEFKKLAYTRYIQQEDWVYTIKHLLGFSRVENMTSEEEPFVKKEFEKIYPDLKTGKISLMHNPSNEKLLQIEGVKGYYLPQSTEKKEDYFVKMKDLLKNKTGIKNPPNWQDKD